MLVPKISYAVTVHNEDGPYLKALFGAIKTYMTGNDELVILDDCSNNPDTLEELSKLQSHVHTKAFAGDFAEHKNYLNSLCRGTHIFNLDADELPHPDLLKVLPEVLTMNPTIELFTLARINVVAGLTKEDIDRWGWRVDEKNRINFPDRQGRIYANIPEVKWEGKVHEKIVGFKAFSNLPEDEEYCILHIKSIDRQRKQNEFYSTL
jgi:glycosyltransferase involved in cell wall biosynthesis